MSPAWRRIGAGMRRWREALAGGGLALLGLWALLGAYGLLATLGAVAILAGLALSFAGWQRGRFRGAGCATAPGLVRVVEGQIAYFGPETGGVVALDRLQRLAVDAPDGQTRWLLSEPGQPVLAVPAGALGAEALFDAFARLPGIDIARLANARPAPGAPAATLWLRPARALS